MGELQRTRAQRVEDDPAQRPLPSFEMPWLDAVDPDRTLKRPALHLAPSANSTEEICADDVLEVVKLTRVLPPPRNLESTQEVAPEDVLGVAALRGRVYPAPRITVVAEPSPRPLPSPPPPNRADPAVLVEPAPASVPPVALDVSFARSRAESTFSVEDTPFGMRMPRMGVAIAAGLGAMIGVFVLVFALGSAGARSSSRGERAVTTKDPAATAATAAPQVHAASEARPSVPTFDVSSLPRAPVGTVSLATTSAQHRLFVDGSLVTKGSAVVSCGKHVVKVGSRGRPQEVDVPCGADVVVGR